jgi:signal transduction histidine kinase
MSAEAELLSRALARIRELESEIVEIADHERRRLSADLHDGLGQELTGISLMLRGLAKLRRAAGAENAPQAGAEEAARLEEIIGLLNRSIQSTRDLSFGRSPAAIDQDALPAALQTLIAWSRDSHQLDVRLCLALRSPPRIDEAAARHLYLMAQEGITNAVRHGSAHSILVTLRSNRARICLSIADDGLGIANPAGRGRGMGLKIMQYRCSLIGAAMNLKKGRGGGTRLRIVCPQGRGRAGAMIRTAL